ncbi:MAG: ComF family protein [Xanthomonadales bacterium]|nr:ComF family protein [Gammaproteobacteria bacterium]MBT8054347.1 ComF family protein [Gammaproteobacteria bacterium]NND57460.1 ComF family protein [Xanthomonadales bacterium]NNK51184.1 ComF family protein [Xanthomonadales bacterium]
MERALDSLLPRHCILCGCASGSENLCPPCAADLPRIGHSCRQCALPLSRFPDAYCGQCLARPPPWDSAAAALLYRFPADQLVCRFKFGRNLACGRVLSQELLRAVGHRSGRLPSCILPVPLHRRRHLSRTFNQSDLLAGYLGKGLGIPVVRSVLRRRRQTSAQSGLDAAERKKNIGGAFGCRISSRRQPLMDRVVLVDDVMTTGATLAECTAVLKKAGAGSVWVWVAARAEGPHQLA